MNVQAALEEFHRTFEHHTGDVPAIPDDRTVNLRRRLIREEVGELLDAIEADDLVEIADGAADAVYVIVGTCVSYGIPFNEVFEAVHRANMNKLVDGAHHRDAGGKTIKPSGWQPPDIAGILGLEPT